MNTEPSHAGTTLDPARGPSVHDMIWLTSYADVDDVFRSRDFEQGGGGRRDSEPFVGDSLLALSGNEHFERRRLEAPLFRRAALRRLEASVVGPAWDRSFRACTRSDGGIVRGELQQILRSTLCQLSAALAGIDGLDDEGGVERFLGHMDRLSAGVNAEWATTDHRAIIREGLAVKQTFAVEFFAPSRDRRARLVARFQAGEITRDVLPHDLLTIMLLHPEHFGGWDDDLLLREVILFSGAPVSITVGLPHAVRELSTWFAAYPEDARLATDHAFLRQAITESLRLRPASPYLIRRAIADHLLPSGKIITAGTYVMLDLIRASRDPAMFGPDPERFNPRRQPLQLIKPFALGFGSGPHTCIAMNMTMGEGGSEDDGAQGLFVLLLAAFYRAGGRLDPNRPPRRNDANARNEYIDVPVCFDFFPA